MTIESLEQFLLLVSQQFLSWSRDLAFDVQYLKPGRDAIAFEAAGDGGTRADAAPAALVNGEIVAAGPAARVRITPPPGTYLVAIQYRETCPETPYLLTGRVEETPIASFTSPAGTGPSSRIAIGLVFFGRRAGRPPVPETGPPA
ncbi:MAG: hypothetical protein JO250_20495 [Armatimonadetes bacterium]|nr:hypothetical protein [Armatimonadota bacterium]